MAARQGASFSSNPPKSHESDDEDVEMSNSADDLGSDLEDPSVERVSPEILELIDELAEYLCEVKEDDEELAAGFQRIPNRRTLPDYFDVISNPVAFSTIRGKIQKKLYTSFAEFVKDVAQICHNAQVYNRPSAPIFGAAVRLREVFVKELQNLAAQGKISASDTTIPDLGELPPAEESLSVDSESSGDEDVDDDDDDYDGSDDEYGASTRRTKLQTATSSRMINASDADGDIHKARARPTMVLTPVEARIAAILRDLRKLRDRDGNILIAPFERLPDRAALPDYYQTISNPIALDNIKKKAKRKKYVSVEQAMSDINIMFENAKTYNEDGSALYEAAAELQLQAKGLAEQELAKSDDEFRDEDGRLPLAEIHHNGEIWRVGDWVHIRNSNDLAKPIVAQIFGTWQDRAGEQWINACWYYRPEQTVHRFEKHFYEYEVVKTGQYRDHQIGEVLDRCFVMFVTRFNKGRPRGFPANKQIYVCESRYNEEKFQLNKIKTWASCMPDEVQDRDYEMDLFDMPREMKKVPSPIKHLLRDDAKETDELPRPTWGSPNAPPIVGAVHRRAPEKNESPPPSSTSQPMNFMPHAPGGSRNMSDMVAAQGMHPMVTQIAHHAGVQSPAHQMHLSQQMQQTPVPLPQMQQHSSPVVGRTMQFQNSTHGSFAPSYQQTPMQTGSHSQVFQQVPQGYGSVHHPRPQTVGQSQTPHQVNVYNPPRPPEVYTLPDTMNDALPETVRAAFQHDVNNRVLFFTSPPLDRVADGVAPVDVTLGHSAKYLSGRQDWLKKRAARKFEQSEGGNNMATQHLAKKTNITVISGLQPQANAALTSWFCQMDKDTEAWKDETGL